MFLKLEFLITTELWLQLEEVKQVPEMLKLNQTGTINHIIWLYKT